MQTVTWAPRPPGHLFFRMPGERISSYIDWVTHRAYSAMLFDGSLLQLTWTLSSNAVVGHRLAFIPCPYELDLELLQTDPVLDVVEVSAEDPDLLRLRGALRFDFDPEAEAASHPASHATLLCQDCRVPVAHHLGPNDFFRFVFQHFYPAIWKSNSYLRELPPSKPEESLLSDDQRRELHMRWFH